MSGTQSKARILVVDDDEAIRHYLEYVLSEEGYTVSGWEDGSRVDSFEKETFDLVICDIAMPGKDGIETIIEMRRIDPAIKVIAMSGLESKDRLLEIANTVGSNISLKKPFEIDTLLSTVAKVLAS